MHLQMTEKQRIQRIAQDAADAKVDQELNDLLSHTNINNQEE